MTGKPVPVNPSWWTRWRLRSHERAPSGSAKRPNALSHLLRYQSLPEVRALAAQLELDDGDTEVHLRRTVTADGRSRGYVNGRPVPVQTLKDFADIWRTFTVNAAESRRQRELLGALAHAKRSREVAKLFDDYQDLSMERDALLRDPRRGCPKNPTQYQVEELMNSRRNNEFEITGETRKTVSRRPAART